MNKEFGINIEMKLKTLASYYLRILLKRYSRRKKYKLTEAIKHLLYVQKIPEQKKGNNN